ncbi:energy transducer TonB [Mycoavidus cysteinexigens]|nr:energy transducer TonB [Mycoavidus cysteinexigens]
MSALHIGGFIYFLKPISPALSKPVLASAITVELLSPAPLPITSFLKAPAAKRSSATPTLPVPTAPSANAPINQTHAAIAVMTTHTIEPSSPPNIAQPNCLLNPPTYPPLSRRREETGTVLISIMIDKHGTIESATIKQSSGFKHLDQAAREAALSSQCRPWLKNGQPIRTTSDIPFIFKLEG